MKKKQEYDTLKEQNLKLSNENAMFGEKVSE